MASSLIKTELNIVNNPAYGELIDCSLSLYGRNSEYVARTQVIPFPIKTIDQSHVVSLHLLDPKARQYAVSGIGFKRFERVTIDVLIIYGSTKTVETYNISATDKGEVFKSLPSLPENSFLKVRICDENMNELELYLDKIYPISYDWYKEMESNT